MRPVLHPCGRPAQSGLRPAALVGVGLAVVLAAMAGPAPGAEADAPATAAAPDEQVLAARRMMFDAARGPERAKAGEALIDALLEATEARVQARAHPEALALAQRALVTAILIKSPRRPWIEGRVKALGETARAAREVEDLKKQLQANPQDAAAREKLVRLFLVTLDDPAEAAQHLEGVADESLRKYVPAAAKGVEAAPDLARLTLGEWYQGLAEAASPGVKAAMLVRARAYYQGFLAAHPAEDLDRAKAVLALQKVEGDLDKMASRQPPTGSKTADAKKGIDLLVPVDLTKDVVKGDWQRQATSLQVEAKGGPMLLVLPVQPCGNYELEARFVRTAGSGTVIAVLPVASKSVALCMSWSKGQVSALELIDGKGPKDNETGVRPGALQNNHEYALLIKVLVEGASAQVAVSLDGKPYISWQGPVSALSLYGNLRLRHAGCLGIGASDATVVFGSARLRMLSGEAKMLRPEGAAGPEKP